MKYLQNKKNKQSDLTCLNLQLYQLSNISTIMLRTDFSIILSFFKYSLSTKFHTNVQIYQ